MITSNLGIYIFRISTSYTTEINTASPALSRFLKRSFAGIMSASNISDQNNESLKLAIALSLLRAKSLQNQTDSSSSSSYALRWRRKAKERKQEILRLKADLNEARDVSQCDLFPESVSCKCYFFDTVGKLSSKLSEGSHTRFNDVLRRRFLRQVRLNERRRTTNSSAQLRSSYGLTDDDIDQFRASVDFLVELCDTVLPAEEDKFANLAHEAVDFILASLKNLLSMEKNLELIEGTVNSLITRLVKRICSPLQTDESQSVNTDAQCYVQHLIRKLGKEHYIGQRILLSVSQRICILAERMLFSDPFDEAFPQMHESMFVMMQLIEFFVVENLPEWSRAEDFNNMLLQDWVTSIVQARKSLEILESRNGLYVMYMDRITGQLVKGVFQVSSLQKLNEDVLASLIR